MYEKELRESQEKFELIFELYQNKYNAEDIFFRLMASGADKETSLKVIGNEKYLREYINMKEKGINDIEVALKLRKEIINH